VTWDDLLQEAITRVLVGSRRQPDGVTMVAFLVGIMRSRVRIDQHRDPSRELALSDPTHDPERSLMAREELAAIERLFAGDLAALQIIAGLAEGRSAAQIRAAAVISKTDYDSARKRMRRALLREGLTCENNRH